MTPAVTLDMSKAQPLPTTTRATTNTGGGPVTLDMSKATPLPGQQSQIGVDPRFNEQDEGHQNRMSALAGLTGMPTINMTPADKQSFEQGKAAGAVSVPVVAGAVSTPAAIWGGINALAPALTRGVVGMTAWAAEHPIAAKVIWESLKTAMYGTALHAGAKTAGKIIKASSEGE